MRSFIFALLLALTASGAQADLRVFATVPEWAALAQEIGGERVRVHAATTALQDPHRIEARPSLLAQARQANLLIATGADLEVGWLPLVLRDAANAAIQPGQRGYFEAAALVSRLEVPGSVDRVHGDVHVAGNPHVHLDPRNLLRIGEALAARMAELDPAAAESYRNGYRQFASRWQAAIARWEREAAPLRGLPVLVHHASFAYLSHWLGLREVGTLEPKPGVEPTSGQLLSLVAQRSARLVLRAAYQPEGPSLWVAEKAGMAPVLLPYTVGGTPAARDLTSLFDDTLQRLLRAPR